MAAVLKRGEAVPKMNEPVTFQPDKIKKIGYVSLVEGKPSIYFSGEDTQFLVERMGHTIIGKFSHSIPSSHQIQKCLSNMKFIGGVSWKYINTSSGGCNELREVVSGTEWYAGLVCG